jgi:hypothetical protein
VLLIYFFNSNTILIFPHYFLHMYSSISGCRPPVVFAFSNSRNHPVLATFEGWIGFG